MHSTQTFEVLVIVYYVLMRSKLEVRRSTCVIKSPTSKGFELTNHFQQRRDMKANFLVVGGGAKLTHFYQREEEEEKEGRKEAATHFPREERTAKMNATSFSSEELPISPLPSSILRIFSSLSPQPPWQCHKEIDASGWEAPLREKTF